MVLHLHKLKSKDLFVLTTRKGKKRDVIINHEFGKISLNHGEEELF